jgi:DNA-binding MarR family transcriptional regulator
MESTGKPNDPLGRFALSIFRINGLLLRTGDRLTRSIGQSSARWQVLGRVGAQPQTVSQIARDMGHARQSVQRVADILAKEGLIVYRRNPANRRAPLLELTPHGADILRTIYALNEEWTRHVMTRLHPEQLDAVADALEEIAHILEADEQQAGGIGNGDQPDISGNHRE